MPDPNFGWHHCITCNDDFLWENLNDHLHPKLEGNPTNISKAAPTMTELTSTPSNRTISRKERKQNKMKAIETRYIGPTNYRGARIKADDGDGNTITIPCPYELDYEDKHRKAAQALCDKMGWTGDMVCGATKRGYVFVFTS